MMERRTSSGALDWAKVVVVPLTAAIISAAVVLITSIVSTDQTIKVAYVGLATDALSRSLPPADAPEKERKADQALREWAVDVLADSSPVTLADEAKTALQLGEVTLILPDLGELGYQPRATETSILDRAIARSVAQEQCEDKEPGSIVQVDRLSRYYTFECVDSDQDGVSDSAQLPLLGEGN